MKLSRKLLTLSSLLVLSVSFAQTALASETLTGRCDPGSGCDSARTWCESRSGSYVQVAVTGQTSFNTQCILPEPVGVAAACVDKTNGQVCDAGNAQTGHCATGSHSIVSDPTYTFSTNTLSCVADDPAHTACIGKSVGDVCDASDGASSILGRCDSNLSCVADGDDDPPTPPPPPASCSPNAPFCALAPIPGLTDNSSTSVVNSTTLAKFLNNLYKYLLGIAAAAAVIEIIWGGIQMAVNRDSVSSLLDSKSRIMRAIQGLILVFAPFLVFSIINPAILSLNIGLTKLQPGPPSPGSGVLDEETGCTVVGQLLQTATCPSSEAAQEFVSNCAAADNIGTLQRQDTYYCRSGYVLNAEGRSVCRDTVTFTAYCGSYSSTIFEFYTTTSVRIFDVIWQLSLLELSNSASQALSTQYSQFSSQCIRDGGSVCAADIGTNSITTEFACPPGTPVVGSLNNTKCLRTNALCVKNISTTVCGGSID